LIDYLPFFLLPGTEKLSLYQAESAYPVRLKLAYAEGWFMPDFGHTIIRYLVWLGYWIAEVIMFRKAMYTPEHPLSFQTPQERRWLQLLVASQVFIFVPPLLAVLIGNEKAFGNWINVAAIGASMIQVYYLFAHPEVLYSLETAYRKPVEVFIPGPVPEGEMEYYDDDLEAEVEAVTHTGYQLTEEMMDKIEEQVQIIMDTQKPFTQIRYGIRNLANDTGIPSYRLSAFINKRCGSNFYGYLNQYRIQYCITKFLAREHQVKTLEALAQECGFQSRSTFIRAFKAVTGKTPSEYISAIH
jgi:AraC-like DNA-binding protein